MLFGTFMKPNEAMCNTPLSDYVPLIGRCEKNQSAYDDQCHNDQTKNNEAIDELIGHPKIMDKCLPATCEVFDRGWRIWFFQNMDRVLKLVGWE